MIPDELSPFINVYAVLNKQNWTFSSTLLNNTTGLYFILYKRYFRALKSFLKNLFLSPAIFHEVTRGQPCIAPKSTTLSSRFQCSPIRSFSKPDIIQHRTKNFEHLLQYSAADRKVTQDSSIRALNLTVNAAQSRSTDSWNKALTLGPRASSSGRIETRPKLFGICQDKSDRWQIRASRGRQLVGERLAYIGANELDGLPKGTATYGVRVCTHTRDTTPSRNLDCSLFRGFLRTWYARVIYSTRTGPQPNLFARSRASRRRVRPSGPGHVSPTEEEAARGTSMDIFLASSLKNMLTRRKSTWEHDWCPPPRMERRRRIPACFLAVLLTSRQMDDFGSKRETVCDVREICVLGTRRMLCWIPWAIGILLWFCVVYCDYSWLEKRFST